MPIISLPIAEVTVYSDRAMVTRRGAVATTGGAQDLVLTDIPWSLDVDSVRAGGRGEPAVRVLAVDVRPTFGTEAVLERRRALEAELRALCDREARLDEQATVAQDGLSFAQELLRSAAPDMARALAHRRTDLADVQGLLDFARAHTLEAHAALAEVATQRRALAAEIEAAQLRLDAAGEDSRQAYAIALSVEATGEGQWEAEVSYVVDGAGWQPIYDLHVQGADATPTVAIGYGALVSQSSGEEWPDVALTLSTARPGLGTLPPTLAPWFIDLYRPTPPRSMMARARRKDMASETDLLKDMASETDRAAPGGPPTGELDALQAEQAAPEGTTIEQVGATVSYRLPGRADIPSDGSPHKVAVAEADLPAQLAYESIPRLLPYAFMRAEIQNTSELLFLPGKASVFQDGRFVGGITIHDAVALRQELTVYLGIDEAIRVERELTRRAVDKTLIGGNRRTAFSYRILVGNNRPLLARLTLRDQVPVSRHEGLKVRLTRASPQPDEHTDLGELRWELTIPPGETREVGFDMTVEHSAAQTVVGL